MNCIVNTKLYISPRIDIDLRCLPLSYIKETYRPDKHIKTNKKGRHNIINKKILNKRT